MTVRNLGLVTALLLAMGMNVQAFAGTNDFFGSGGAGAPGSTDSSQGAGSTVGAGGFPSAGAPAGDYTVDEKRVQKKYKSNLESAKKLISKGESMMKSKDDKVNKKGKILKEIGEKRLAELKANSPFPEIAGNGRKVN